MGDKYRIPDRTSPSLEQGLIVSDLVELIPLNYNEYLESRNTDKTNLKFKEIKHPYSIIVTQSCDLGFDYDARQNNNNPDHKLINCVVVCDLFDASILRQDKTRGMNTNQWNYIKQNNHERYYFLQKVDAKFDLLQSGLPEFTADFKKFFAIETGFFYYQIKKNVAQIRTVLANPYLESFCSKYYNFQSRVALPEPHESI